MNGVSGLQRESIERNPPESMRGRNPRHGFRMPMDNQFEHGALNELSVRGGSCCRVR